MNAKRLCIVLAAALGLLFIGLIATTYGISGLIKDKSRQLAVSKAQVNQLSAQQSSIARSKHDVAQYSALATITKSIVPQDKDQAEAIREITNIAQTTNVTLNSVAFSASTIGSAVTSVPGAPGAPAAPAAKSALSQVTPVVNIPGVYDLQIIVNNNTSNTVTFSQLDAFLKGLENNRRTAEVSSLLITPQNNDPDKLVFSLTLNDYIKPSS